MKKNIYLLFLILVSGIFFLACEDQDIADAAIAKIDTSSGADSTGADSTIGKVYVAVGGETGNAEGSIYYSTDAQNWNRANISGLELMNDVTYDSKNKLFIAVGEQSQIWISSDGKNWEDKSISGGSFAFFGVSCNSSGCIAVGESDGASIQLTYKSVDGIDWISNSQTVGSGMDNLNAITSDENYFMTGYVYNSTDVTFNPHTRDYNSSFSSTGLGSPMYTGSAPIGSLENIIFVNGQFTLMGNYDEAAIVNPVFQYSSNLGVVWTDHSPTTTNMETVTSIAYDDKNTTYLLVGGSNGDNLAAAYSTGSSLGGNWSDCGDSSFSTTQGFISTVIFGDDLFLVVGGDIGYTNGYIYTTTDQGSTFIKSSMATTFLYGAAFRP